MLVHLDRIKYKKSKKWIYGMGDWSFLFARKGEMFKIEGSPNKITLGGSGRHASIPPSLVYIGQGNVTLMGIKWFVVTPTLDSSTMEYV